MLSLTERRVPSKDDLPEAAVPQIIGQTIAFTGRSVFACLVARSIHDPQRFASFRQRYQQRMVAPDSRGCHVHSELAFARGFNDGTVHIDRRTVEEFIGLLTPHVSASLIDSRMQTVDVCLAFESATEVSGGRCIRNAFRAECIQIRFVRPLLLQIFQARSVGHRIESDVEHVIGFMIRKVTLQQLDVSIDRCRQPALPSDRVSQSDSAVAGCRVSIGDFELHAGGRQHRSIVIFAPMFVALFDSANAIRVPAFRIFNPSSSRIRRSFRRRRLPFLIS